MPNSEEYFRSKRFKDTLAQYEENEMAGVPNCISSDEFADIAEYYYNLGNEEAALNAIETAIRMYPGETIPLVFRAKMEMMEGGNTEKAREFIDCISDKSDIEYVYIMSEILLTEGREKEADAYLEEQYSKMDEEDEERDFFCIDIAAIYTEYEDIDIAEKWFARCRRKDILEYKEVEARITMARGEFVKSQKLYQELIDKNPYSTGYWNALASSQFFNNEIEESINSSEFSIAIDPENAPAILNKANALYNLGNHAEALKYYEKYNRLSPEDDNGIMLIGLCHLLLEDFSKAVTYLREALDMCSPDSPNAVDLRKDLAYAMCRLDLVDDAMALLDETKVLECDHDEMLAYRGSLLLGCKRFEEARQCFIKALENTDFNPSIMTKIAMIIYESGDIMMAYKMFKSLYANTSDWHKGIVYYAVCCFDLGKHEEFFKVLKLAVEHTPDETKEVLGTLFPDGMSTKEYYDYAINKKDFFELKSKNER